MKLGLAYNIFNGDELLEDSLKRLRPLSDYIVLTYQTISNVGLVSKDILPSLNKIDPQLFDEIICFEPIFSLSPPINETNKRNLGLELCKQNDCTHYMSIDCDEFYRVEQFINAKNKIIKNNYESTACELVNYFHNASNQMIEHKQYVPFITKITEINHEYRANFIVTIDPTRIVPNKNQFCFHKDFLLMHHMSCVRKDYNSMKSKLQNSPNKHMFKRHIHKYLYYFNNWIYPSPALNIHQFKKGNVKKKNIVKIENPIYLSTNYTPKKFGRWRMRFERFRLSNLTKR